MLAPNFNGNDKSDKFQDSDRLRNKSVVIVQVHYILGYDVSYIRLNVVEVKLQKFQNSSAF